MFRSTCTVFLAMGLAQAQGMPGRGQRPPLPPVFQALDTNHDGVLSSDEVANASASLKKLDLNGDGHLSAEECRPQGPGGDNSRGSMTGPGEPAQGQNPPPAPIDTILDSNRTGVIDANELADAPAQLKKLDANGDGKLTLDEVLPKRLGGPGGR